jgi:tRNA(Ile)-lysidine synthase
MELVAEAAVAFHEAAETTGVDFRNERLVVAVSGGPDSLALLDVLTRLMPADRLIVAHLDHGLRPASAAEAATVAGVAAGYGLRFQADRVDVARLARERGLSLEAAGRTARYDFLAEVARREGATAVAAGHNADDQVETVLMHFMRGSGLGGLRGMRSVSPLPGHADLWLLRPLLGITRAAIEAYCVERGLAPITDDSNADPTFLRNRLRHDLLPRLESYNPQIRQRLRDMAEALADDEEMLADLTAEAWGQLVLDRRDGAIILQRSGWRALPLALRRRLLRRTIAEVNSALRDVGFQALEAARRVAEEGQTGAAAALPGGVNLRVEYDRIVVAAEAGSHLDEYPQLPAAESIPLTVPGEVDLGNDWRLAAEVVEQPDRLAIENNIDPWTAYVAGDLSPLLVRVRQPGERLRPLGLGGATKIKEVMIDRKLPAAYRARWPIVATADHVVWIAGVALDDRARVKPDSRVVRLRCVKRLYADERGFQR